MSGDGPHNKSIPSSMVDPRTSRQPPDNSPLQIFVKAKKKINDIFGEIEDYVKDAVEYMHGKVYSNRVPPIIISFQRLRSSKT